MPTLLTTLTDARDYGRQRHYCLTDQLADPAPLRVLHARYAALPRPAPADLRAALNAALAQRFADLALARHLRLCGLLALSFLAGVVLTLGTLTWSQHYAARQGLEEAQP